MKILAIIAICGSLSLSVANSAAAQDQSAPAANATQNPALKSPNDMTQAPLAKGQNSFTKGQALARIQSAGYTHVMGLMKEADGLWQAQAMYNGQSVHVALDYKGNVASQ